MRQGQPNEVKTISPPQRSTLEAIAHYYHPLLPLYAREMLLGRSDYLLTAFGVAPSRGSRRIGELLKSPNDPGCQPQHVDH